MIETKGKIFGELNDFYIKQAAEYTTTKFMRFKDKYYLVGYNNMPILKSDIGGAIVRKFPLINFSAVYSINSSSSTSFSLRSTDCQSDVSEIATSLGGGGHRNASGVYVNYVTDHLPGAVFESNLVLGSFETLLSLKLKVNDLEYNCIQACSPSNKRKLGTYLLQSRYIDKDKNQVQECAAISKILNKEYFTDKYKIAIVWTYNFQTDETKFVFTFDKSFSDLQIMNISDYLKLNDKFEIKLKGLHREFPNSHKINLTNISTKL